MVLAGARLMVGVSEWREASGSVCSRSEWIRQMNDGQHGIGVGGRAPGIRVDKQRSSGRRATAAGWHWRSERQARSQWSGPVHASSYSKQLVAVRSVANRLRVGKCGRADGRLAARLANACRGRIIEPLLSDERRAAKPKCCGGRRTNGEYRSKKDNHKREMSCFMCRFIISLFQSVLSSLCGRDASQGRPCFFFCFVFSFHFLSLSHNPSRWIRHCRHCAHRGRLSARVHRWIVHSGPTDAKGASAAHRRPSRQPRRGRR